MTTEAVVVSLPAIVKAFSDSGRRMVETQASSECLDVEGDVILQAALLGSAKAFEAHGTIDVDHISEIGHRLNPPIKNPLAYIIGRPVEVKDIGNGNTSVLMELHKSRPGVVSKADEVWASLQESPPVPWRASIYGFPSASGFVEAKSAPPGMDLHGATRYLVSQLSWKSLALTLNPVCQGIEGTAQIIKSMTAKSMSLASTASPAEEVFANYMFPPRSRDELLGQYYTHICKGDCNHAGGANGNSVFSFRLHFTECCGMDVFQADIASLALMHLLKRESRT